MSEIKLYWFRLENRNWRSDFEAAWRRRCGDPDYKYALQDEIARRTQDEYEPVADYITCLRALLKRGRPLWLFVEQLHQAHRNMLPRLRSGVRRSKFHDFGELEKAALRLEKDEKAEKSNRSPLSPEQSMFSDLTYRRPRDKHKNVAIAAIASAMPSSTKGRGKRAEPAAATAILTIPSRKSLPWQRTSIAGIAERPDTDRETVVNRGKRIVIDAKRKVILCKRVPPMQATRIGACKAGRCGSELGNGDPRQSRYSLRASDLTSR